MTSSPDIHPSRQIFLITISPTRELQACYIGSPEKTTSTPFVIVGGWASNLDSYTSTALALAKFGHDSYTIELPRAGRNRRKNPEMLAPEILENKAQATVSLLEQLGKQGIQEVNMIGHSEGGITATVAALTHLQKSQEQLPRIRSLTLVTPAGLNERDNAVRLGVTFIAQGLKSALLFPTMYTDNNTLQALSNPIIALREVMAIATSNTALFLKQLHETYGIPIHIITGKHDPVFPTRRVSQTVGHISDITVEEMDIRHNSIVTKAEQVVKRLLEIITK